jgi:hypothetical protein
MLRRILTTIAILFCICSISAAETQTYIGPGFAFAVNAPTTWIEARPSFAPVLFHLKGTTADASPTVIYVRPMDKASLGVKTARDVNALDLREMRKRWPSISSKQLAQVSSADKIIGEVFEFVGGQFHERVAYFDHGRTMVLIVLSTENPSLTTRDLGAWRSVVESYRWIPELAGR